MADVLLGRYVVRAQVGVGSQGAVFEVVDRAGNRRALKVAQADAGAGDALLAEFAQLARLSHPSLPRVLEVSRTDVALAGIPAGSPCFVAAWIDGVRADAVAWPAAQLAGRCWALCADVAAALAAIHAAGLVHGDVAPGNVLIGDDGRAVLVDLGLSVGAAPRGTPAYLAPEALTGGGDPRSDLYGLGAVVTRIVAGRPPFEAATLGELAARILSGDPPAAVTTLPGPLADLVGRLLARNPSRRPSSALAVLAELDELAPAIDATVARRAQPGAHAASPPAAWPGAAATIDDLRAALDAAPGLQLLVAPPGTGGRELATLALGARQLAAVSRGEAAPAVVVGDLDEVAAALGVGPASAQPVGGWLVAVLAAIRSGDLDLVVDLAGDPRQDAVVGALGEDPRPDAAHPARTHPARVLLVDHAPAARPGATVHLAPLLDGKGVAQLARDVLGFAPPAAWAEALRARTGGRPARVRELLHAAAQQPAPAELDWDAFDDRSAADAALALAPGPARLRAALAAWGGRVAIADALATAGDDVGAADLRALVAAGAAQIHGGTLAMSAAAVEALRAALPGDARAALARRGLARAAAAPPEAVAALLELAPCAPPDAARAVAIAAELLARGRPDRARALACHAAAAPAVAGAAFLIAARGALALAAYPEARALAAAAQAAGAPEVASRLIAARAAQRGGDLDAAEAELAALAAVHSDDEVIGAYARLLVTRARFADAARVAGAPGVGGGLRAEAAGLAAFYVGDLDGAERAFAALERAADGPATGARALSLRGMVAQQRGQLALAGDRYREAMRGLRDVGEVHAAAVAELNLGTVLAERGRASEALPRLAAAGRTFHALGATTEWIAAELNRGNALLAVGQVVAAQEAAAAAVARADGAPHLRAFALLVAGDADRRAGDDARALRGYRAALAIGRERDDAHAALAAAIALTEAGVADVADEDGAELCRNEDDRDRWALATARRALPSLAGAAAAAAAERCEAVAARAVGGDRLERAFRAQALAARLRARAGEPAASRAVAIRARTAHAALIATAAPSFRAAVAADPDRGALDAALPEPGDAEAARADPSARDDQRRLRRLLTLSRRLNSADDVARILDDVIDTAIELTLAERGFLLLREPAGELRAVVSRNFDAGDLGADAAGPSLSRSISRSIAERAVATGEPVVTIDAGVDERFGAAASVAALQLRSVLAVPLRQRGQVIGCVYVDHRLRGGAFDAAAAADLGELADLAAIAIENARLTEDLRRTTTEVAALNQRLAADLADRDAELVRVRAELPDRERLGRAFDPIIGRAPAMSRMLAIVDRAAATSLPVVLVGESGTGKELIARALHDAGPRRAGPFVTINCGAVPEALLESELFGHVRGAFTGADRERRGLFEVADHGTLFLDEIADTSAGMQVKLLRVLQQGEIRRVGEPAVRRVDVRIVAATQLGLGALVEAGRFREDLRFRLEVIAVAVPPLRERDGDLPLLVGHLLAALCPGRAPPRLTRAALRALAAYGWPGNVRELHNALARAVALGGEVLDVADFPEAVAHAARGPGPARPRPDGDLKLRPALAATESAYVAAAMSQAHGNQTVAARLLGLSRFGLQKKLRRKADEGRGEPGHEP